VLIVFASFALSLLGLFPADVRVLGTLDLAVFERRPEAAEARVLEGLLFFSGVLAGDLPVARFFAAMPG
jgi:hypothetical protein